MAGLDWRMLVGCLYLLFKVQPHHTDHYEEEDDHAHHDEAEEHPQHVHLDKINEVTCQFLPKTAVSLTQFNSLTDAETD